MPETHHIQRVNRLSTVGVCPRSGDGRGMGLATAEAFADACAAVALVDLNEAAVRKVAERLTAEGHKAIAIACDVTGEVQVN